MFPASRAYYNWSLIPCQSSERLRLFPRTNVNMSRGVWVLRCRDFAESPLSTGGAKISPHWWMCFIVFLKNAEETQRESHQRHNLQRTQKSSLCRENACPGKLLSCMLAATFVAGRRHQSASKEDVQKLPYFMVSSSQDGFLWVEALTRRTHTPGFPAASWSNPWDGPWPSAARRFAGEQVFHLCATVHHGSAEALIFHSEEKQIDFKCGGIRFLDFPGARNLQKRKLEMRNVDSRARGMEI